MKLEYFQDQIDRGDIVLVYARLLKIQIGEIPEFHLVPVKLRDFNSHDWSNLEFDGLMTKGSRFIPYFQEI